MSKLVIHSCFPAFFDYRLLMWYTYKVLGYLNTGFVAPMALSTWAQMPLRAKVIDMALVASVGTLQPRESVLA